MLYGPKKESGNLGSLTIVDIEHATKALAPFDRSGVQVYDIRWLIKQSVTDALVISLPQIMGFIFAERPAKRPLTEKNHALKTGLKCSGCKMSRFESLPRLTKDYECKVQTSDTFLQLAMIRFMLNRVAAA